MAIDMLNLRPGEQVLDVGCGTGLNFALIQQKIGAHGLLVGIDRSPQMLEQARRRAARNGWANVILIEADATAVSADATWATIRAHGGAGLSQAVLATYALSLMPDWESAWANMLQMSSYGARMAVVDMQVPTGPASLLAPLAKAACRLGGADINAHPWGGLERDCDDVKSGAVRGGHIQIRTGCRR